METNFIQNTERAYLVTTREQILQSLMYSKSNRSVIGISSPSVRPGVFLCVVKEVSRDEDEDDYLVVLDRNVLFPGASDGLTIYLKEIRGLYAP